MDLGYDINKNKVKDPSYYWVPRRIKADLSKGEMAYLLEHRDEFKWLEVTEESIRTYEMDDDNNDDCHTIGWIFTNHFLPKRPKISIKIAQIAKST